MANGRTRLGVGSVGLILLFGLGMVGAPDARASDGADARNDVAALEKELVEADSALSTSDCLTMCRALSSMRRAAERICVLSPGDRCAAARERFAAATLRVRETCPQCATATAPLPNAPREEPAATPPAPALASESKHGGGCAGCAASASPRTDGDPPLTRCLQGVVLVLAALLYRLRRRQRHALRL